MRMIDRQIEQFLTNCQIKQLSKKTMKAYSQALLLMADYLQGQYKITDAEQVRAIHISDYIGYLQERGKYTVTTESKSVQPNYPDRRSDYRRALSKTTINNYIRDMRVFFNFLVDFDYIDRNPMRKIKQLRNDRRTIDFITDSQFESLMRNMDISKYHEYRDKVIMELLLDSGMRVGECLSAKELSSSALLLPTPLASDTGDVGENLDVRMSPTGSFKKYNPSGAAWTARLSWAVYRKY